MAAPPARVTERPARVSTRATIRVAVQSSRRLLRDALSTCLAVRPDVTVVGKVEEPDAIFDQFMHFGHESIDDDVVLGRRLERPDIGHPIRTGLDHFHQLHAGEQLPLHKFHRERSGPVFPSKKELNPGLHPEGASVALALRNALFTADSL